MFNHTTRKWSAAAAGCLLAISAVTACSSSGKSTSAAGATSASTHQSAGTSSSDSGTGINVGSGTITPHKMKTVALIINYDLSTTYSQAMVKSAQAAASKAGVKLDVKYDHLDAPTELANYQSVISSGKYDGLIIQPLNSQLCQPIATDAVKHNLPVVVIVSTLCDNASASGDGLWSPGTLSYVGGMADFDHTITLMKGAASNSPGPQKVMLVVGTQTLPNTISFLAAYKKYLATNPQWSTVDTVYTDFSAPDALNKTQNALQGHKDTTMIITSYTGITDGVVQAIKDQSLSGKVATYDFFGGSARSVDLIKAGQLTGSLPSYPASMTAAAFQALLDAGNGQTPKRFIDNDGDTNPATSVITKNDVASLSPQY
jgi:ribose transport system substrate-binding protein